MILGELLVIGKSSTVAYGEHIEGELTLVWQKGNAEEEARAEKAFREYVNRGWLAVGEASGIKKQIFAFDPSFDRIVLSPIMVGG